jgi:hypothetical protein
LNEAAEPLPAFDPENLTLPEGAEIPDEDRTAVAELASKYNLPHAAVEDFVAMYFSKIEATGESLNAQIGEQWEATLDSWKGQILEKFDGSETKMMEETKRFQPYIDRFGGDSFREALDLTGIGNHPAMFEFLSNIADAFGEATPVSENAVPQTTTDPLRAMYKNSPQMFEKE